MLNVARERIELSSRAPEAPMLGRYTTGLRAQHKRGSQYLTLMLRRVAIILVFYCFPNTVAFLTNPVVALTVPKRVYNGVLVLGVAG